MFQTINVKALADPHMLINDVELTAIESAGCRGADVTSRCVLPGYYFPL